ncbi:phage shock protein PspC (stress-responsive transcriptional regulator) [Oikeobacillus pervagus]|uniref:Phage shock protein PspC (Stress-responsive transcriptional regulator) n=1 Tax=Oikeobacillus pervagus TaxID=1325931 RepID=A0AAJ1WJR7_9BACI|nr:PspC domain-containing protein [Oikeobacillus pervagus]MDQ0215940.1 phage shock protein PspC (stress-responsive transcriptional regulator) [Oikeobacillus pervagus]
MKKVTRSTHDRKIAGVLGGLSEWLGIHSSVVRVLFILFLFPSGMFPLVISYGLLMFVLSNEEDVLIE